MSLDAIVYCDCFEKGRLLSEPPGHGSITVSLNGDLEYATDDFTKITQFDQWKLERACVHRNGELLHHRLGNIDLIGVLRNALQQKSQDFPILLNKVLYSGSHTGDRLSYQAVLALELEVEKLKNHSSGDAASRESIDEFETKLSQLIKAAKSVQKPISF